MDSKKKTSKKKEMTGNVTDQQCFFGAIAIDRMDIVLDQMWPRLKDEGKLAVLKYTINIALPTESRNNLVTNKITIQSLYAFLYLLLLDVLRYIITFISPELANYLFTNNSPKKKYITEETKRQNLYKFLNLLLIYEQLSPSLMIKLLKDIGPTNREFDAIMDLLVKSLKYSKYDESLHLFVYFVLQKTPKGSEFSKECLETLKELKIINNVLKSLLSFSPALLHFFEDYLDTIIPKIAKDKDIPYLIKVLNQLDRAKSLLFIEQYFFLINEYLQGLEKEKISCSYDQFLDCFKEIKDKIDVRSTLREAEIGGLLANIKAKLPNSNKKRIKLAKKTAKMEVKFNYNSDSEEGKKLDSGEGVLSIESILAIQNIDYSLEDGFKLVVSSNYKRKKTEKYLVLIKKKDSKQNVTKSDEDLAVSDSGDQAVLKSNFEMESKQKTNKFNKHKDKKKSEKPIESLDIAEHENVESGLLGVFDPRVAPLFFIRLEGISYVERDGYLYEIHHLRDLAHDIVYYPAYISKSISENVASLSVPTTRMSEVLDSLQISFKDPEYWVTSDDMVQVASFIVDKSSKIIFIPSIDISRSEGFGSIKAMLDNELLEGTFRVAAVNVLANGHSASGGEHWIYTLTCRLGDNYFALIINTLRESDYSESINLIREQIVAKYNNLENIRVINTGYQSESLDFSSCGVWVLAFLERTVAYLIGRESLNGENFSLDALAKEILLAEGFDREAFIWGRRQAYAAFIEENVADEAQIVADTSYELHEAGAVRCEHIFQDLLSYFRNNSLFSSEIIDSIEVELMRELMINTSSNLRGREFEYEYLRRMCRELGISVKIIDEEQHHYHEVSSGSSSVTIEIRYTGTEVLINSLSEGGAGFAGVIENQLNSAVHDHPSNLTVLGNDAETEDFGLYNLFYTSSNLASSF